MSSYSWTDIKRCHIVDYSRVEFGQITFKIGAFKNEESVIISGI